MAADLDHVHPAGTAPQSMTVEHGTACTSMALVTWAFEHRITLDFTRPGKPADIRQPITQPSAAS